MGQPCVGEDQEGDAEGPHWPRGEVGRYSVWFRLEQRSRESVFVSLANIPQGFLMEQGFLEMFYKRKDPGLTGIWETLSIPQSWLFTSIRSQVC